MGSILFWNLRHLAEGSDADRAFAIATVVKATGAELSLFCEVMHNCGRPKAQNINYREKNAHQLCYGALDADGVTDVPLEAFDPAVTQDYKDAGFKGGSKFSNIVNRGVGMVKKKDGVHVYMIHAPADGDAKKAVSFVACALNETYQDKPWLLIGDLNVEPKELAACKVGIELVDLIKDPGEPTHENGKTLDYALSNIGSVRVKALRKSSRLHGSDHGPILVMY